MTSTSTDRRFGVNVGQAIKVPVAAATTANITLSAAQTIDGVSVVAEDRVLVKNQTTASENGIYICQSGDWVRAPDGDGSYDFKTGTMVYVNAGTTNANTLWYISTTGAITIGTTSITWTQFPATALTGGVTPSGTLTANKVLVGGGTSVAKASQWGIATAGSTMTAAGDLQMGGHQLVGNIGTLRGFTAKDIGETINALSISTAGVVAPDFSDGPLMTLARSTAALTLNVPTALWAGCSWIMRMTSTGGGGSITFNSAYRAVAGSSFVPSTSANAVDLLSFLTVSTGGTIDYAIVGQSS